MRVADPSQVRARAATLSGSAKRSRWQGASRPLPDRLSVVAFSDQSSPEPKRAIWSAESRADSSMIGSPVAPAGSGVWTVTPADAFSSLRLVGSASAPVATSEPDTTSAAAATPAPITVCVRRRAAPARRMTVARGQRISSSGAASSSSRRRTSVVCTSRASENCDVAVCSSRSASERGRPTMRPISVSDSVESPLSTSSSRWRGVSLASASSVLRTSGASDLSRCQMRAVCLRRARRKARGRT